MQRPQSPVLGRRELLSLSAGFAGVAGCSEDATETASQANGADDAEGERLTFVAPITGKSTSKEAIQFNPFNVTKSPWWGSQKALFLQLAVQSYRNYTWYPLAAKRMDVTGDSWRIELHDSLQWANGDPVTATDLVRRLRLDYHMDQTMGSYVERADAIRQRSDVEVEVQFDREYNAAGFRTAAIPRIAIATPEPVFDEYVERFADASTESATEDVRSDLGQFSWDDPRPYTCGPFDLVDVNTQGLVYRPSETYPRADVRSAIESQTSADLSRYPASVNYDYEQQFFQSGNTVNQAAITDRIDGGAGIRVDSTSDAEKFPDHGEVRTNYAGYGISLLFNVVDDDRGELWRDRRVRKAIARIIDRNSVVQQFFGDYSEHDPRLSGLTSALQDRLLEQPFLDSLVRYERDQKKAASLLRDAGFTEGDRWWRRPNGERLTVTFGAPTSIQYYVRGFQSAVSNLKAFGIQAELNAVEGTSWFSNEYPDHNWDLTHGYYGYSNAPRAWFLSWMRFPGTDDEHLRRLQEPFDTTAITVPAREGSGTMEIDVRDHYDAIKHTADEDEVARLSREFAWAFNQLVPRIPIGPAPFHWYLTNDDWIVPPDDSPLGHLEALVWMLPHVGALGPR
jgi:peptide/nickel transport system substrate-binding protein